MLSPVCGPNVQAYDAHMNLVLGGAEETIHTVDVSEDGQPQPPRVRDNQSRIYTDDLQIEKRSMEMLFVRGDSVILVCATTSTCGRGAKPTDIAHTAVN